MIRDKLMETLDKGNINLIDLKIMVVCNGKEYSVTELQQKLRIAYKNLLPHIKKLEGLEFIRVIDQGRGRKKIISTSTKRNVQFFMFGLMCLWIPEKELKEENKIDLAIRDFFERSYK